MQAVAGLPCGAVVLPGVDRDMRGAIWAGLTDPHPQEDHPQYRFAALAQAMGTDPAGIPDWVDAPPPSPTRNALVSLALRPAPVTDGWRRDGPGLGCLRAATDGVSLIEAPDPRSEALAIALCLREALEQDRTAALITPDRMLTRRVAAELDRWGIVPDDSAGEPLRQTAAGRLIRHVAALMGERLTAEALVTILKHPPDGISTCCGSGSWRSRCAGSVRPSPTRDRWRSGPESSTRAAPIRQTPGHGRNGSQPA